MKPFDALHGIGDLLVVKQNLLGYRESDLAETRTIMAGELYEKKNRSLRREERSRTSREEREEQTLKELQTTERFELAQESQKTILSETAFQAGAEVSAGFGPVAMSAFFDFSTTQSETETNTLKNTFAREVVEKSIKNIIEKTFEEQKETLIEEFEEHNLHRFENLAGQNRTGLYYWLEKVVRLKVVNYGKRVFYKFVVPEPAAFFVMSRTLRNQNDLPEEPVFPRFAGQDLRPEQLSRANWRRMVAKVQAAGVKPPPPKHRYITKHILREFTEVRPHFTIAPTQLDIPKGYVAERIDAARIYRQLHGNEGFTQNDYDLDLIIGKTHRSQNRSDGVTEDVPVTAEAVAGDVGSVPIGVQFDAPDANFGTFSVYAAVRIRCVLEDQALQKWQMETYDAIVTAYNNKRADYEERLAQASVSGGFQIAGRPPEVNRETERTELKKSCITMWTGFRYDGLPGISHDTDASPPNNYPEVNVDNAFELAPEIEFLERGFDWRNMTYEFVPYYWGRKKFWLDTQTQEDPDPLFQSFLQAGAAIVMVPCRIEYTKSILYYQLTGALRANEDVPFFHGGDPGDTITFDTEDNRDEELALYHSFVQEVEQQEPLENLDSDIVIDPNDPDAWVVSVPISMVFLSSSTELPAPDV